VQVRRAHRLCPVRQGAARIAPLEGPESTMEEVFRMPRFARKTPALILSGLSIALFAGAATAQTYPAKGIRIIVAYTPAGTTDILARALGQKFSEAWGQPVMVDNRPGANGNISTGVAAKSPPDGHTLLMATAGTHGINPTLYPKLAFDAIKDFAPISLVAVVPNIVVVHPSLPVKNLRDLVAYGKANPGRLTFGAPGVGSTGHLSGELFKTMAGISMTHIAYKGSAPTMQDLIGGQIPLVIDNIPPYLPQVKAGKIRALAVTTAKRTPAAPDLPTVAEAGVPGYEASAWFGLFAPAGTPPEIVSRISAETQRVLKLPDVNERLAGLGAQPAANSPQEYGQFVRDEIAKWAKVIRAANVSIE